MRQDLFSISENISGFNFSALYLVPSVILLLIVAFFLIKTYRATKNVEKKLAEFSSLSNHILAGNFQLIETHSNEHKLNKKALGPLARIIDEYAVTVIEKNGFIIYANQKYLEISGFSLKELIEKVKISNAAGLHDDKYWQEMWLTISNERVWHGEIGNISPGGRTYWVDTFIFPLSYISSENEGFICFGTDITAIKQQNTHLKDEVEIRNKTISKVEGMLLHSEKMASLGTISAGIAHEINNPVAFISCNVTKLNEYLDQLALVVKKIQSTHSNASLDNVLDIGEAAFILEDYPVLIAETNDGLDRIRKIIKDLKCFSHEQTDSLASLDIHKCIETSLNLAKSELKYKAIIQKDYDAYIPMIQGSETQLSQVLINIFINAAHAIETDGMIRIMTRLLEGNVVIRIADNGSGIEPDVMKSIFEPFFTTKPVGQGTGLGLSISHDIIKRHGGEIDVESEVGAGTTFVIKLPVSLTEAPPDNVFA
jgi:two-component system NtrC family sensor kinase